MHLYVSQANVILQHNASNEIVAYYFNDKIIQYIRVESIKESFINFFAYDVEEMKQDAIEVFETGEYEIIQGEVPDEAFRSSRTSND